ncbi:hypothetical protein H4I95_11030 [Botrytis cinerea]
MDELEAQQQAYIHREQEKQDRFTDSAIHMPTSSIPFPEVPRDGVHSSDGPFPRSPPGYSPRRTCVDPEQELVRTEVQALQQINSRSMPVVTIAALHSRFVPGGKRSRRGTGSLNGFKGVCQYEGIVRPVVAAIMVAGPFEVVNQEVWSYMRAEGILGSP